MPPAPTWFFGRPSAKRLKIGCMPGSKRLENPILKLDPERLEELRDRYLESAALFRESAQLLREELHRRGYSDEQITAMAKRGRPRRFGLLPSERRRDRRGI
jgi:hypothetical protein